VPRRATSNETVDLEQRFPPRARRLRRAESPTRIPGDETFHRTTR
jgi:hypothetical protein